MEVIRCRGLTKCYGGTVAVDDLDLGVRAGQVFGFLGPNGSGKTTTMRMLLGLVPPSRGQAWLNGRELPDPAGLPAVGAMIEEPAFYPWMSGRANLVVAALAGPPLPSRRAIDAALERVGLGTVASRKVKTYSQGMRQRLGLAMALMRDPALLILDEPMNGMDPAGIREFRQLLRDLAAEGKTVFLSSHLLSEVELVCDEVAVLNAGRLIEQGRVHELSTARARVRVVLDPADLGAAARALAGHQAQIDGSRSILVEGSGGADVARALGEAGVWPLELRLERPSLEESFLDLTAAPEPGAGRPELPAIPSSAAERN